MDSVLAALLSPQAMAAPPPMSLHQQEMQVRQQDHAERKQNLEELKLQIEEDARREEQESRKRRELSYRLQSDDDRYKAGTFTKYPRTSWASPDRRADERVFDPWSLYNR